MAGAEAVRRELSKVRELTESKTMHVFLTVEKHCGLNICVLHNPHHQIHILKP